MIFVFVIFYFLICSGTQPNLIPAVQQWNQSLGSFSLLSNCCLVAQSASLLPVMKTFQNDLFSETNLNCSIVSSTACNCSIIFTLTTNNNSVLGDQGYQMQIIQNSILISAQAPIGVFYATRTLLQLFRLDGLTIPSANILDYPKYPTWRGLMQDAGRLYVPIDWLINMVKDLSYFKMNIFHIHGMDNQNYRLQSTSHPEITATAHWTNAQIAQLIAVAQEYFVELVWETETCAHTNSIISKHPELAAVDMYGNVNQAALDLTNPAVFTFISQLLNESLTLFSTSKYAHIGGDEWISDFSTYPQFAAYAKSQWGPNATPQDVYLNYLNRVAAIVIQANKSCVCWNDNKQNGGVFSINKNIIMDGWTYAGISQLQAGFKVINSAQNPTYPTWYGPYTVFQNWQAELYSNWSGNQWSIPGVVNPPIAPFTPGLLGQGIHFWFDNFNVDPYSAVYLLRYYIRTISQQSWASGFLTHDYNVFKTMSDTLGHSPSTTFPLTTPPILILNGPYSGTVNVPVVFSSAGTTSFPGAQLVSYWWDFSDSHSSNLANPIHTYTSAGTYVITTRVVDSNGMTGGNQTYIVVSNSPAPPPPPSSTPSPPTPAPSPTRTPTRTPTSPPTPSPPTSISIALNKPTTASTTFSSSYLPNFAVDGSNLTRWCPVNGDINQWIQIDLGQIYTLVASQINFETSPGPWSYMAYGSTTDPTNISTVLVNRSQNVALGQGYYDRINNISARYIRLVCIRESLSHWFSVEEISLFGT